MARYSIAEAIELILAAYEQLITRPIFSRISEQDVEDVIVAINKVIHHYHLI